ncbi:TlpA family protein disulfide reductase [Riemerella columbina]|uniref:TlpA family protein disulfide reductase n=1 Tax=Riemerella columbina TaxID=103810 RepID=UPI0003726928|nr:TlpA disulfide reductase family protein [Riemerella columbina]
MKKLVLGVSIALFALSCEKKDTPISTTTNDADSTEQVTETTTVVTTPKEVTKAQLADLVTPKDNDTLYVTNFFATWCGPCMMEIPHFKEKMKELEGQPVKFTFVSLDQKSDWDTKVKEFGEENGLSSNIVLFDGESFDESFFSEHFKTWKGESIPFTLIQKGKKSNETVGSMSKEDLNGKLNELK